MKKILSIIAGFLLSQASMATTTLKIATISPEGSFWMNTMRAGAKEIKERTNGNVKIKLYPAGVMGSDDIVLRKIRIGQLQGAALTSGALSALYPDSNIYSLPAIFSGDDEVKFVRKTIDPILSKNLNAKGFEIYGVAGGGFTYLMSKSPVLNIKQLRSKKLWSPADDGVFNIVAKTLELKPITVPLGDVMVSLQTGLINAVTVSPVGALVLQWHTQVKYLTDMPLFYTYAMFAVDKKALNKLSEEEQAIVREVFTQKMKKIDEANEVDAHKAKAALLKQGIEQIQPKQADISEWHDYSERSIKALLKANKISPEIVQTLEEQIAAFRKKKA